MDTFTIDTKALAACRHAAADKDVRYYLNGVLFEPATARLVATDGRLLFACKLNCEPVAGAAPVIIPNELIDTVLKTARKQNVAELTIDGQRLSFAVAGNTYAGEAIDGNFPDWRRVVRFEAEALAHIDPAKLEQMQTCFALAVGGKRNVPLHSAPPNGSWRVTYRGFLQTVTRTFPSFYAAEDWARRVGRPDAIIEWIAQ